MATKIGAMRESIQVLRATSVDDGFSAKPVFSDLGGPILARKRDLSDGERFRAGELASFVMTRFTVHKTTFTDGLTPRDRLRWRGREYEITGIKDLGDGRMWREITCTARTDT